MLSIGTNTGAIMAQGAASSVTRDMETAMHRLSTGKRINAAADDAAGVAISSRLDSTVRGLNQSIRNALDAQALIDTAEGAMQEIETILQRIRELSIQAANDTNSADDRTNLNAEAQSLLNEIDRISSSTTWAGQSLLDGTFTDKSFQVGTGTMAADQLVTSIAGVSPSDLGIGPTEEIQDKKTISVVPLGSEVQVNTSTYDFQNVPEIISLTNGNQVIIWQSPHEGFGYQIYAQRYDSSGNTIGSEFNLSSDKNFSSSWVSAAALSDGSFIATWSTYRKDGSGYGVYGQRFASNGNLLGDEFLINTETSDMQRNSSIAALADGGFVIAWESDQQDGSNAGIYAQRFSSTGTKVGSEFQVNTYTEGRQDNPSAFSLENGGFGITWSGGPGIVTQLYNLDGTPNGSTFKSSDSGYLSFAGGFSSASLSSGGSVTTFSQDGSVYAQKHDADGNKAGLIYQVNNDNESSHYWSTVTPINSEYYLVTWTSSDSDGSGVYGRVINELTDTVSDVFLLNKHETSAQQQAAAVKIGDDEFSVTWSSNNQDGSGYGVFKQRFQISENIVSISLGKTNRINFFSQENSLTSIQHIDQALQTLNSQRASLGAISNRLDHIVANNTNAATNVSKSLGRIQDADFAAESTSLAKNQILQQASTAMLAQANASKQNILELLQS